MTPILPGHSNFTKMTGMPGGLARFLQYPGCDNKALFTRTPVRARKTRQPKNLRKLESRDDRPKSLVSFGSRRKPGACRCQNNPIRPCRSGVSIASSAMGGALHRGRRDRRVVAVDLPAPVGAARPAL